MIMQWVANDWNIRILKYKIPCLEYLSIVNWRIIHKLKDEFSVFLKTTRFFNYRWPEWFSNIWWVKLSYFELSFIIRVDMHDWIMHIPFNWFKPKFSFSDPETPVYWLLAYPEEISIIKFPYI